MFNFKSGEQLASLQDQYIKLYKEDKKLSPSQILDLEQNLWIKAASYLAPCNLVIRQYALIDLFKDSPDHSVQIYDLLNILSCRNSKERIWLESYSYYKYTMEILNEWLENFPGHNNIQYIIDAINKGFIKTAYIRNGLLYPAPFGDLYDEPLNVKLDTSQITDDTQSITIGNITCIKDDGKYSYIVKGNPIGFNTHVPKDDYQVEIVNGIPINFKFYEGYNKKYSSAWQEYTDTFSPKRIASII
jgi:hypothetical protein